MRFFFSFHFISRCVYARGALSRYLWRCRRRRSRCHTNHHLQANRHTTTALSHNLVWMYFFFVCAQEIGSCTCVDYLIDRYAHVTFKRETERDEKQIKLLRSISYVQKIFKRHLKQLLLTHQNQTQGKSVGRVNIGAKRLDGVVKWKSIETTHLLAIFLKPFFFKKNF